jgi:anti-anti-sigma factor
MADVSGAAGLVTVQVHDDDSIPICEVRGEIDASNVDSVLDRLVDSVPNDASGLVLDLSRTMYLDSAGVRILFELARRMRARRQELRIAVPQDGIVRRVLVLTAVADVVPLHDDPTSAADALRRKL